MLVISTMSTQDFAVVVLVEGGGGNNFVAVATAEAVSMEVFVAVTGTLAHDGFITCSTKFSKLFDVAWLTEGLIIVGDEGFSCQLLFTTRADETCAMIWFVLVSHPLRMYWLITSSAPYRELPIITLLAEWITLVLHVRDLSQ